MPDPTRDTVPAEAFQSVAILHQLTVEACLCRSRAELVFHILNRTIALCTYDRAVLWDLTGGKPRPLGISGQSEVAAQSPMVELWQAAVATLGEPDRIQRLPAAAAPTADETLWRALAEKTGGLAVLWVPVRAKDRLVAGLWLERWGDRAWEERDEKLLASLALGYGGAWKPFFGSAHPRAWLARTGPRTAAAVLGVLLVLLFGSRVHLRVVAPCEVVPREPVLISAPLNGVIAEMCARPDRPVGQGDLLFTYDKRVVQEELKVAQEQVRMVEADLRRARFEALRDPSVRAQIRLLEHRLEQEEIRLRLAEENQAQLEVTTPIAGVVVIEDPHAWRGRPVTVGERVLTIVDPTRTQLRIWLPENDNIQFAPDIPASVFLNIDPGTSHAATLTRVALYVETSPSGIPVFRAEADWVEPPSGLKVGLRGICVIYGPRVSLAYWLVRKPWIHLRRWLGI